MSRATIRTYVLEVDAALRNLYRILLDERGHEVMSFSEAPGFLQAFQARPADLVIMDLVLAGMDGLEACRRLRALQGGASCKVLVCTTRTTDDDVRAIDAAGADEYLAKPIQPALLSLRLRRLEARILSRRHATEARQPGEEPWRYEILRRLAESPNTEVYEARDRELDVVVALKIFTAELDGKTLEAVRREVLLSRRLMTRRAAKVFDLGERGGRRYLTMERIPGETLRAKLDRDGALDVETALSLALDCALGLAAAHDEGIVHADIKPSNLMVTPDQRGVLLDFGNASEFPARAAPQGNVFRGTPRYGAPELFRGEPPAPPSDVYAAGCVLYEMVTGKPVFDGGGMEELVRQHLRATPEDPRSRRDVGGPVADLILRCLEKDPARRPADGAALADAIEAVADARASS